MGMLTDVLDYARREIERVSAENARLTARIAKAIDRINACPTLDDPDAMIACISDVEVILATSLKRFTDAPDGGPL